MNALYSVTDKLSNLFFGRGGPDPGGGGTEGRNQGLGEGGSLNNSFSHDAAFENFLGREAAFEGLKRDSDFPSFTQGSSHFRSSRLA
jgi:hypothetical protein